MYPLPGAITTPGAKVMEHDAPRWQVVGQHPPGATSAQHVADGVDDLPPGVGDGSAARFGRWQQGLEQLPFSVAEVAGIRWSFHTPKLRPTPLSCLCISTPISTFLDALLDQSEITSDTPVPFDLHDVWYRLEYENNATYQMKSNESTVQVREQGDPASLKPPQFVPYGPGGTPPHQGQYFGTYGNTPSQLRLGLLDPKLKFLHRIPVSHEGPDPLIKAVQEWLGGTEPISVLDFSGVPTQAADVAVGTVITLLFELALRSDPEGPGIGRPQPVLLVIEEAHRFLREQAATGARDATSRIAREGRKYGVGLMLVSQRPSELPDTVLSQCGTLIALRLTNSTDQGRIRAALPDAIGGLAAVLPSLRTGEAIVSGEAVALPARVLVDMPNPMPQSEDPSTALWRKEKTLPDVTPALERWRGIYQKEETEA